MVQSHCSKGSYGVAQDVQAYENIYSNCQLNQTTLVLLRDHSTQVFHVRLNQDPGELQPGLSLLCRREGALAEKAASHLFTLQTTCNRQELSPKPRKRRKGFFKAPCRNRQDGRGRRRPYSRAGTGHHQQFKGTLGSTLKKFK